jgi:hypothetical protein
MDHNSILYIIVYSTLGSKESRRAVSLSSRIFGLATRTDSMPRFQNERKPVSASQQEVPSASPARASKMSFNINR